MAKKEIKQEDLELKRLISRFISHLEIEKNYSKFTLRNYRFYLTRFRKFFEKKYEQEYVNRITPGMIESYRLFLSRLEDKKGSPLSRATQSYHVIALRAFFKYLSKKGIKSVSPEKIDLPKAESRRIKFLSREQVERLLDQPLISEDAGMRDKAILEVLFSTGLRVSEIAKLNREDIDLKQKEFGVVGKGRRVRVVFLTDRAVKWLGDYLARRDDHYSPLWIRYSGKKADIVTSGDSMRLSVRSIQRIVEKYRRRAQLPIKVSPHVVRHSFATTLLQNGADLRSVQEMLGHKNVSTTQIYTHVTNPQLKKTHERFLK